MKCPYCGQETPDDSTFCAECGERLDDMPLDPSLDFPEDPEEQKPRGKEKTPLLIAAYESRQSKSGDDSSSTDVSAADSGYILPQSSARLLTERDLSGLSLREINYAKNEIYARHGRMFNSRELQDYFNSQSWYSGAVSPEDFSESVLSDVEKQNAQFLSSAEFSMDPNGYQLDAN